MQNYRARPMSDKTTMATARMLAEAGLAFARP